MPLIKTPVRKGMNTRSSGVAERSEDFEHSSGDVVRSPEVPEHLSGDATELTSAEALLRAAMEELRQMRGEREQQQQQREQLETALRLRDEEIQRLQGHYQLSPTNNREISGMRLNENLGNDTRSSFNFSQLGYKLKPDIYDGSAPLREFLAQFELISLANKWDNFTKSVALATSLRGKARSILDGEEGLENLSFSELKAKLEFRFGEGHLARTYYSQFTNRRLKNGEDFITLGAELERLSRLAYPECSHESRDKIACAQFVSALPNGFIKRTLQLEDLTSLKAAVQRAMAVKIIQESNAFGKEGGQKGRFGFRVGEELGENNLKGEENEKKKERQRESNVERGREGMRSYREARKEKECWQCGAKGHFRFECPANVKQQGN